MSELAITQSRDQILIHDQVQNNCEWMTLTVSLRRHEEAGSRPRLGLAICISSSFGAFAHEYYAIHSGLCPDPRQVALTFLADTVRDRCGFLDKLLLGDNAVPSFEDTLKNIRRKMSQNLEAMEAHSTDAQALREDILAFEDAVDDICDNWGATHQVAQIFNIPALWRAFPEDAMDLLVTEPSARRRQAEGFFDQLWKPYAETLQADLATPV